MEDYGAATLRPNTLRSYEQFIRCYIKPYLGDKIVSRVTRMDIQKLYRKLKHEGRVREHPEHGHELSDTMVLRIHAMLHRCLKDAEAAHVIARNPTDGAVVPKASYKPKQILTKEQMDTFLAAVDRNEIDEREVDRTVGHDLRAVAFGSGLEERGDVRHHARRGVAFVRGQIHDLILGDADVVQPLCCQLDAGAVAHVLLDEVALVVPAVEAVDPDQAVILRLLLELTLAVDGPADEPARVAAGDDAGSKMPSQAPPATSMASRMWMWSPGICPSRTRKQAAVRAARPLPTM